MLDEAAVAYQIILTKTDKIKPTALAALEDKTADAIRRRARRASCDPLNIVGNGLWY